ncbi:histone-binding protein N1/N2-like [Bufo bufo]|uniref:histone-binding protein N1/N2-like n=1 Tax=Bufo bufo TaxID=8384 RepID=UPI001ABEDB97|nr:histone-binding protein N1/N2-like [Bufo bufo]
MEDLMRSKDNVGKNVYELEKTKLEELEKPEEENPLKDAKKSEPVKNGPEDGGTVLAKSEKMEEVSSEQVDEADVEAEVKRLMAVSSQDRVMKDVPSAINAFQEASGLMGKKYEETDGQHADVVYYCEMALIEPARKENIILGDPLEGMPEDEESDEDRGVSSTSNLDEKEEEGLRMQVYDAVSEKDEKANKLNEDSKGDSKAEEAKDEITLQQAADELVQRMEVVVALMKCCCVVSWRRHSSPFLAGTSYV